MAFSGEIFAYGNDHIPPFMWTRTPVALQVCILVGLSVLLFNRRWPRPLRTAAATLCLVVGGVQFGALVKHLGLDAGLVGRLPRLHYFEFYVPLFYSVCGGFALYHWRDLAYACRASRARIVSSVRGAILFFPLAFLILPVAALVAACIWLGSAFVCARRHERAERRGPSSAAQRRLVAGGGLVLVVAGAIGTWLVPTADIFPVFFAFSRCRSGILWCRDPAGTTMGADDNPITRYLRHALSAGGRFAGRAETLVRPPVRFGLLAPSDMRWTQALFDRFHAWYVQAYGDQSIKDGSSGALFSLPPQEVRWDRRQELKEALRHFVHSDFTFDGPFQEDLVLDMWRWIRANGREFGLAATDLMDPWDGVPSAQALTEERTAAFFATGNGLLLRALPFQNVPVASSYEQALGYLYYLLWTRYVDAGVPASKSINTTVLEALHPERLALLGVRIVVARDSEVYEPPPLERLMGWRGYSVYAVREPNVAGYAVSELEFADTLAGELRLMRSHGFEPRRVAVLAARERAALRSAAPGGAGTLTSASIALSPNELTFSAKSSGGPRFVVLPFGWSHCWQAEWRKGGGRLVRADVRSDRRRFLGRYRAASALDGRLWRA